MATVPSATPQQFDSVGPWQTRMPSSVAAAMSTSSVPTVHFATTRRSGLASRIRRVSRLERIDVPSNASAPSA